MALYLITGGAGFIGSHIAHALLARGDRVRILDNMSSGKLENLAPESIGPIGSGANIELIEGEVFDPGAVATACVGVHGIFHEAALVSVPRSVEHPELSFEINVQGTFRMLEGARRAGVKRFVMASSAAIYGAEPTLPKQEGMAPEPVSPYGGDKLTGETMLAVYGRSYGMQTVALRYFNVFGPKQDDNSPYSGVIAIFAKAALEQRSIKIHGDGEQTRDFVFVEDVAQANLLAMGADVEPGRVYNVGVGEACSIKDLQRLIGQRAGFEEAPEHLPERGGDLKHSLADIGRIQSELGFKPSVGLSEGLGRTLDWYRTQLG